MFRRFVLASVSVFALSAAANAADMYVPGPGGYKDDFVPVPTWAGLYAGLNGGYGWSAGTPELTVTNNFGASASTKGLDATGGFGGGDIGYNWQRGAFVFGVEGDIEVSHIGDLFARFANPPGAANFIAAQKYLDYFSTIRARVGYASGNFLVYGTGGLAYGYVHNQVVTNGVADDHRDAGETGYAVGGGVEYAITPRFSLKAEYQYIDFGSYKLSAPVLPPNGVTITTSTLENSFNTVRVGINYHLRAPEEPLK